MGAWPDKTGEPLGYDYALAEAGREMYRAITDELERQHTDDLPDRYIDWIDRDALTSAVMQKIDELSA